MLSGRLDFKLCMGNETGLGTSAISYFILITSGQEFFFLFSFGYLEPPLENYKFYAQNNVLYQ